MDHDEHVVKIKSELAAGHHENLARELAHQREQLRKSSEAEKHALTERLNEKRIGDLADQAAKHDAATAALTEELTTAHDEKIANLEAEWHERREEAVKVYIRIYGFIHVCDVSVHSIVTSIHSYHRRVYAHLRASTLSTPSYMFSFIFSNQSPQ